MEKKMSTLIDVMCKGLPVEVNNYVSYTRTLGFEDKPDYGFLRKMFRELFMREKYELDFLYDWTISERVNFNHTVPSNKLQINLHINRDINTAELMKDEVVDSIFQKPSQDNKSQFAKKDGEADEGDKNDANLI